MRGRVHPNRPKNLRPQTHPTTRSDRCFYLSQRAGTTECFWPCSTEAIQDPASELPRIPLPRTPVNRGKSRGRDSVGHPVPGRLSTALAAIGATPTRQRLDPLDLFARLLIKGGVPEVDVPVQARCDQPHKYPLVVNLCP